MGCVASREGAKGAKAPLGKGARLGALPTYGLYRRSLRLSSSPAAAAKPGCDCAAGAESESESAVLAREIAARQQSPVHTHVTRFEQLHARAQCPPVLRDVCAAERGGKTGANVAIFERLEQAARETPTLQMLRGNALPRENSILDRVRRFERLEQKRREEDARSLAAFKSARETPARAWAGNKIRVAVTTYSM